MKRFEQINVIPFIDIMLVLLAIVLTTATFIAQGIVDIHVPDAENNGPMLQGEYREIAIDGRNRLYFDGTIVDREELATHLRQLTDTTSLVLRVDKSVPFERFIMVIDLLKENRLERLSIVTRRK
uniref:Biopolymer transport protein ExbD n=1 Tax=Candidatus Kentrum sp. DK TaxID=2126562 RepID=A0A450T828_9GAMM|nr:MAG: biopolymer transport protein ExbD [Candidatus Kentron sp. DK]